MVDFTLEDALIRFDSLVCRNPGPHGCWVWLGARTEEGYGTFYTQRGGTKSRLAHRWHWFVRVGPLRADEALDHICRNRACVRLDHLRPVSWRQNTLAGDSPFARNARKTHCLEGHPLEDLGAGGRRCRICHRESMRRKLQRRRAARAQAQADAFRDEWNRLPHLGGYQEPACGEAASEGDGPLSAEAQPSLQRPLRKEPP